MSVKHAVLIPKEAEDKAGLTAAQPFIFRSANRCDRQLIKFTGKSEYRLIKLQLNFGEKSIVLRKVAKKKKTD